MLINTKNPTSSLEQMEHSSAQSPVVAETGSIRDGACRKSLSPARLWINRVMGRFFLRFLNRYVIEARGLEHIAPRHDPFILALNHSQKFEAFVIPVYLIYHRRGHLIHFLSDWNYRLYPGLAFLLRFSQTICIVRKPAKPKFLNLFKPLFQDKDSGFTRSRRKLLEGGSLGIYPEGTVNRNPRALLRGYTGAARLSLVTGAPVVPAGVQFPGHPLDQPIPDGAPFIINIGAPLYPPKVNEIDIDAAMVRDWHHSIMREIARLSHKEFQPHSTRRKLCP